MTIEYLDTPIDYGEDVVNYFIPKGTNAKYLEIKGDFPEIKNIRLTFVE